MIDVWALESPKNHVLGFHPAGMTAISRWSARRHHRTDGIARKFLGPSPPGPKDVGMHENPGCAAPTGANGSHPSGMQEKDVTIGTADTR